jgi:hypothetical protein
MRQRAKITPADYPDLLAAEAAGVSQRKQARRRNCAPSLIARHLGRARRDREANGAEDHRVEASELHNGSMREVVEARIRDPKTSARDLASLVNALARLEAVENPAPVVELEQRREGKYSLHELKSARRFQLPRFMPGVSEWFDALAPDVELWKHLPDAPVELVDGYGDAHDVLAEEESFFRHELGWKPPPVWEPQEDFLEEMRARIAELDASRAA